MCAQSSHLPPLQAHPSAAELINALLLNRDKEIRILGNKALCKLYVHDEVEPTAHEWLLALLVELLPRAKEASVRGEEFFEVRHSVRQHMLLLLVGAINSLLTRTC